MSDFPARFRLSHSVRIVLFLIILYNLWSLISSGFSPILEKDSDHHDSGKMDISIRPASANDLEAIVNIVIKAFPYDEQFAYRYPYREQYPEDHYKYTELYYSEYLNTTFAGQNTIMVAEAPDLEDSTKTQVIALSIWDNPGNREPNPDIPAVAPPKNHPERKDCNPARLKAFSEATMKARKDIFVAMFGERQLSLRQMATFPDYWRRGAASMLLKWGMERARKENVAVPMFAGNMGKLLYLKLGFKELERVQIQAPNETEVIYVTAMAWDPKEAETADLRSVDSNPDN
ncbi:acyl-CoA N-acyltransferase [Nemania sp. FL0031]|nr:acyl-CoA N-acyltransferase [Nemania sp. FL0031]